MVKVETDMQELEPVVWFAVRITNHDTGTEIHIATPRRIQRVRHTHTHRHRFINVQLLGRSPHKNYKNDLDDQT